MNGAGKIAAHDSSSFPEGIGSVEAVDRVESNGVDFDEGFSRDGSGYVD